jgi:hypothetical protein
MRAIRKEVTPLNTGRRWAKGARSRLVQTVTAVLVIVTCAVLMPAKSFAIGPCNPDIQVCS